MTFFCWPVYFIRFNLIYRIKKENERFLSENLVLFNFKEYFFETPYLQNAPYPHGVQHASSPSADLPLPSSLDVIYLRPLGWMLYNLGFLCFIWSKFTSTRHENKPIFPHDVMKFYIMNFIWKFQWKFIPTVLTPQIINYQKYHSHLPRHTFLWN